MRLSEKHRWLLGFTAVFAALVGFVFWGTWSTDFAPVMPDNQIVHPSNWVYRWLVGWWGSGKFVPGDLTTFIGGPYVWQELKYVVSLYCAGLGLCYFLKGRGLARPAAYGAGLLLAFSGYWMTLFSAGHLGWFQWMTYGVFAFGLCDRAVRKGKVRHWLFLGATLAWGSFYQSDLWLLFTVLTFAYFVHCHIRERKRPDFKGWAIALAAFVLIGMPSFRNAFVNDLAGRDRQIEEGDTLTKDNLASENDGERRWIFVTNWSLPPAETAEFVVPRLNGDTSCPMTLSLGMRYHTGVRQYTGALGRPNGAPTGNYRQHSLYVGFVTCLLALIGVGSAFGRARRNNVLRFDIAFFAVAALICWLFSLGRYCEPVYRVVFALPFGDYLRAPVKWHHLTELCLCILASYGLLWLSEFLGKTGRWGRFAPWIVGAVVLFGACDLARIDRLYCAPVDIREAKRQDCNMQMTFLRKPDFNNPQIAAMVKAKQIVSLAQPNPELYMVGILEPRKPAPDRLPPMETCTWLGICSALMTFAVIGYGLKDAMRGAR